MEIALYSRSESRVGALMIKVTPELYAAVCVFATIAFVALAFASGRKSKLDDLESMKEFDQ
jgi:hypothetical protein